MSALDIAICVILAYFLIRGIFRGLVKEIVGILGLFVAFSAASAYWLAGAEQLKPVINSSAFRGVLSFVVIYLIVYFLIGLMSVFVDKIVKITITPLSSGLAGAGLGLLKGIALCVIVLAASTAFLKPDHTFYTDSWSWPKAKPLCEKVKEWMPETLRNLINSSPILSGVVEPPRSGSQAKPPKPAPPATNTQSAIPSIPTDFQSLLNLVNNFQNKISPAWREKIKNLDPSMVNAELISSFIKDNPGLFSNKNAAADPQAAAPAQNPPSWPSPARE
jgi:membrane protein required for colicin V production